MVISMVISKVYVLVVYEFTEFKERLALHKPRISLICLQKYWLKYSQIKLLSPSYPPMLSLRDALYCIKFSCKHGYNHSIHHSLIHDIDTVGLILELWLPFYVIATSHCTLSAWVTTCLFVASLKTAMIHKRTLEQEPAFFVKHSWSHGPSHRLASSHVATHHQTSRLHVFTECHYLGHCRLECQAPVLSHTKGLTCQLLDSLCHQCTNNQPAQWPRKATNSILTDTTQSQHEHLAQMI